MLNILRHPRQRTLSRFIAGDASGEEYAHIARHIARCSECHETVNVTRRIESRFAERRAAPAPEGLKRRIRESLLQMDSAASGEQRATRPPRPVAVRGWPFMLAAAAILAIVAILLSMPARYLTAGATAGDLRLAPSAPARGATITASYTPSQLLAGAMRLRLRAAYRTANDLPVPSSVRRVAASTLIRDRDGAFHGTFRLPDSVVYATFAVETEDGRVVDSNARRLWPMLVSDGSGVPIYEALEQQVSDLMFRNWELALDAAKRAAALYPMKIRAQAILATLEQSILTPVALDSALTAHRRHIAELESRMEKVASPDPEEMGAMVTFAQMVGDTARARRWLDRVVVARPTGLWGLNVAIPRLVPDPDVDPAAAAAVLDSLWHADGSAHPAIVIGGLMTATRSGDSAAARSWLERTDAVPDEEIDRTRVAQSMLRQPALHESALDLLRAQVRAYSHPSDAQRPLEMDAADALRVRRQRQRAALATLGEALLADGRKRAALDTLRLAAAGGWDTETFHRIGNAALLAGDATTARDMFARVAVDPSTPPAFADSARARLKIDADDWSRAVREATSELRSRMLQVAERRPLPEPVTLTRSDGTPVSLRALVSDRPTVVVFWSRGCGNALAITSRLVRLTQRWVAAGYGVILVVNDRPSSELAAYLEQHHLSLPLYRDMQHEARRALGQWGTPELFVLDGQGRLRYPHTSLELAGAQLASLR
ncbi:MAG TPA: TlpA disulfide reductase family protein [Gemmatimonadaceae bacterium]|nr:TlpA disulfide reductase family protein [Gemmatimonadaceae bacterium]